MIRATQRKEDDAAVHAFCEALGNRCTCRKTGHVCESLLIRVRQSDGVRKEKRRVEFNSEGARVYQWYQEKMG